MARLDTSHDALTEEVFEIAGKLAKTAADADVIETERTLEILYQLRLARRRSSVFSGTSNAVVLRMAGWE